MFHEDVKRVPYTSKKRHAHVLLLLMMLRRKMYEEGGSMDEEFGGCCCCSSSTFAIDKTQRKNRTKQTTFLFLFSSLVRNGK